MNASRVSSHRTVRALLVALLAWGNMVAPARAVAATLPPSPGAPVQSFDAGTLHVDQYGSGASPIVLIPGLSCGPWVWYGTIAHLLPGHTIYALTLPGFDGRAATTKKPLIAAFLTDLKTLLDDHKIVKPVVIGHSLGGTLAIVAAETFPTRLRSVIAVDGLPVFPTVASISAEQRVAAAQQMSAPLANSTPAQFLAGNQSFMSSFGTSVPSLVDPSATLLSRSDPLAAAAWLQEDVSGDWRPQLRQATVPLTEIMPYYAPDRQQPPLNFTQDQTQAFYTSLLAGAPQLTVVAIPNARHFVMLDQPEALNAALDSVLAH